MMGQTGSTAGRNRFRPIFVKCLKFLSKQTNEGTGSGRTDFSFFSSSSFGLIKTERSFKHYLIINPCQLSMVDPNLWVWVWPGGTTYCSNHSSKLRNMARVRNRRSQFGDMTKWSKNKIGTENMYRNTFLISFGQINKVLSELTLLNPKFI